MNDYNYHINNVIKVYNEIVSSALTINPDDYTLHEDRKTFRRLIGISLDGKSIVNGVDIYVSNNKLQLVYALFISENTLEILCELYIKRYNTIHYIRKGDLLITRKDIKYKPQE